MKEVLVTQGCSGALHSYIAAFANDGDEVVMFEPLWSVY
jgi:aspartate/methionine/tyrosine aminotransferase